MASNKILTRQELALSGELTKCVTEADLQGLNIFEPMDFLFNPSSGYVGASGIFIINMTDVAIETTVSYFTVQPHSKRYHEQANSTVTVKFPELKYGIYYSVPSDGNNKYPFIIQSIVAGEQKCSLIYDNGVTIFHTFVFIQ